MKPAGFAAHGDHAAVATTEPTAHDAFERYMADAREPHGHPRDRCHHRLGAARVHGGRRPAFGEMPLERRDDAAVFAGASVFARERNRARRARRPFARRRTAWFRPVVRRAPRRGWRTRRARRLLQPDTLHVQRLRRSPARGGQAVRGRRCAGRVSRRRATALSLRCAC